MPESYPSYMKSAMAMKISLRIINIGQYKRLALVLVFTPSTKAPHLDWNYSPSTFYLGRLIVYAESTGRKMSVRPMETQLIPRANASPFGDVSGAYTFSMAVIKSSRYPYRHKIISSAKNRAFVCDYINLLKVLLFLHRVNF